MISNQVLISYLSYRGVESFVIYTSSYVGEEIVILSLVTFDMIKAPSMIHVDMYMVYEYMSCLDVSEISSKFTST